MAPEDPPSFPAALAPLSDSDRIAQEAAIGVVPLAEAGITAARSGYGPERLLAGVELLPAPPPWPSHRDPRLAERAERELARRIGGWLAGGTARFVRAHRPPRGRPWCSLAAAFLPWQVQAVGRPGDFWCVFFGRPLAAENAVGEGGHPIHRPLGPLKPLLARAAPALPPLTDRSGDHPPNVFDSWLNGPGVRVRTGVRERLRDSRRPAPDRPAYFYGLRIDLDKGPGPRA